jgi:hypothetical protein
MQLIRLSVVPIPRKFDIYSLQWKDVDLAKYIVAAAPYGGPIGNLPYQAINHLISIVRIVSLCSHHPRRSQAGQSPVTIISPSTADVHIFRKAYQTNQRNSLQ